MDLDVTDNSVRCWARHLYFARTLRHNSKTVHLTPREVDKLLIYTAGELARATGGRAQ